MVLSRNSTFGYDGAAIITEQHGTHDPISILAGLGWDQHYAQIDDTGTAVTLLPDALGSLVGEVGANGQLTATRAYEPFGADTTTSGDAASRFGFTGREHDPTGLIYYRARYLHPATGRFISEDPAGFTAGDANLYAYVHNNPTNLIDPTGEFAWLALCGGGAIVDAGIHILTNRKPILGGTLVAAGRGCVTGLAFGAIGKAFTAMKATNTVARPKPLIIGENMSRVRAYADSVGGHAYRPWKNDPFDFNLGMARNKRMIKDRIREGREIIDIGPDFARRAAGRDPSPFYNMERTLTDGYSGYVRVFDRFGKTDGGVPGLDF
jgi:RHS repeat-associated protein